MASVLFRTSKQDGLDLGKARVIFELVVYVKTAGDQDANKTTQMSCGWCQLQLDELSRAQTHKLEIFGGSPNSQLSISDQELRTNRTGLKLV